MEPTIEIDGKRHRIDELSDKQKEENKELIAEVEKVYAQIESDARKLTPYGKPFSVFVATVIMSVTGLALLSFFSDVKTTITLNATWISIWVITTVAVLGLIYIPYLTGKVEFPFEGGTAKKIGCYFAGMIGLGVLSHGAALSGLPTALHHLTAADGEIEATVIKKETNYVRRKCSPRLIIQEFTWYSKDYICPGEEVFQQIEVGTRVTLSGKLSNFGIEPTQIQWDANK